MDKRCHVATRPRALWLAVVLAVTPGCTFFDDYLAGSPFTPAQPEAAVTLVGEMHTERITAATTECTPGGTVFWGLVRNTGDAKVEDVAIAIDAFNGAGGLLGTFGATVFNGEVDVTDPLQPIYGTSLEVDQSGSFTVCSPLPYGSVARTEYRTTFVVVGTQ